MRVISGFLKGRHIAGYNIEGTRPTMDRVKESLFATINNYLQSSIVLDLFAGSGSLGFEAISNGASKCYFVDNNKKCIRAIQDNINRFKINEYSFAINEDFHKALFYFSKENITFDLIFLDPPYDNKLITETVNIILEKNLLNKDGLFILEYKWDKVDFPQMKLLKKKQYGDKFISIYQKNT